MFGLRPRGKGCFARPDRVRRIEHVIVTVRPAQEMELEEPGHAIQTSLKRCEKRSRHSRRLHSSLLDGQIRSQSSTPRMGVCSRDDEGWVLDAVTKTRKGPGVNEDCRRELSGMASTQVTIVPRRWVEPQLSKLVERAPTGPNWDQCARLRSKAESDRRANTGPFRKEIANA
jgi:hypothetical protein